MKLYLNSLCLCLFLPTVFGNESACISDFVDGNDYFPDKVEPVESKFWSVSYENTYKIAENIAANETYLLYQCGTEPPQAELDGRHAAVLPVPVEDVGVLYTTMIPFLEILGERQAILAFFGSASWVSSPCLSQLIDEGKVKEVLDPTNKTAITDVPLDLPSFVDQYGEFAFNQTIRISAEQEDTNLAAYEWIKFYSVFFNKEAMANDFFNATKGSYECSEENAALLDCDAEKKPVVLWGSYSTYCGGWSVARCPNYYCEFADSCSAILLNSEEGSIQSELCGTNYMTTKEFVAFGHDADYWIYTSPDFNDALAMFEDDLKDFISITNKQVFDTQGSGDDAWFEERLAEPDVVLQDFCAVIGYGNPDIPTAHKRNWFRNVFTESVGGLGQCSDTNAAWVPKGTECVALPSDYCKSNGSISGNEGSVDISATGGSVDTWADEGSVASPLLVGGCTLLGVAATALAIN